MYTGCGALMDEAFGEENIVSQISFSKTTGFSSRNLSNVMDHILWYAKDINALKYRQLSRQKKTRRTRSYSLSAFGKLDALRGGI